MGPRAVSSASDGQVARDAVVEYESWLDRVHATYHAVSYTCAYRLSDPGLAGRVAVQVVAGLIASPTVFRYFGLPYSGRIAKLAEARLADAEAGRLAVVCEWEDLDSRLQRLPAEHRDVLLAACVRGDNLPSLARELNCDEEAASARRASTLAFMRDLAAIGLPAETGPAGED